MLNEKIFFAHNLPVEVTTVNMNDHPTHYHKSIEILYVLSGSVYVRHACREQRMSEGEVCILNRMELHSVRKAEEENVVMVVHLEQGFLEKYYPDMTDMFLSADTGNLDANRLICDILAGIMIELIRKGNGYERSIIELTHNLCETMRSFFAYEKGKAGDEDLRGSRTLGVRLQRVMQYLYENYSRKLTLGEIAGNEDLSLYYLSHVIKEAAGMSFQELLNYIRVEASERLLLETDMKIGAISEKTGFSAVRYYTRHFTAWFGMQPADYRTKYAGSTIEHRTSARQERCSPLQIEKALQKNSGQLGSEVHEKLRGPVITTIEIAAGDRPRENDLAESRLKEALEKPVNRVLAEPYERFRSLGEKFVVTGRNYAATAVWGPDGDITKLSIIVCGMDDAMRESVIESESREELYRIVSEYEAGMEFIIKLHGFTGEYRILRYRINRESIIRQIGDSLGSKGVQGNRERLMGELSSMPEIRTGEYKSIDNLIIRTAFEGIGIELILIDRK